jgi:cytochrome c oxidase subunit IV
MGCNCKKSIKINDVNKQEISLLEKAFLFLKKVALFSLALCFAIIVTPIILVMIVYKMIFKGGEAFVIPDKILKMLK